jgi:hypothetical protein
MASDAPWTASGACLAAASCFARALYTYKWRSLEYLLPGPERAAERQAALNAACRPMLWTSLIAELLTADGGALLATDEAECELAALVEQYDVPVAQRRELRDGLVLLARLVRRVYRTLRAAECITHDTLPGELVFSVFETEVNRLFEHEKFPPVFSSSVKYFLALPYPGFRASPGDPGVPALPVPQAVCFDCEPHMVKDCVECTPFDPLDPVAAVAHDELRHYKTFICAFMRRASRAGPVRGAFVAVHVSPDTPGLTPAACPSLGPRLGASHAESARWFAKCTGITLEDLGLWRAEQPPFLAVESRSHPGAGATLLTEAVVFDALRAIEYVRACCVPPVDYAHACSAPFDGGRRLFAVSAVPRLSDFVERATREEGPLAPVLALLAAHILRAWLCRFDFFGVLFVPTHTAYNSDHPLVEFAALVGVSGVRRYFCKLLGSLLRLLERSEVDARDAARIIDAFFHPERQHSADKHAVSALVNRLAKHLPDERVARVVAMAETKLSVTDSPILRFDTLSDVIDIYECVISREGLTDLQRVQFLQTFSVISHSSVDNALYEIVEFPLAVDAQPREPSRTSPLVRRIFRFAERRWFSRAPRPDDCKQLVLYEPMYNSDTVSEWPASVTVSDTPDSPSPHFIPYSTTTYLLPPFPPGTPPLAAYPARAQWAAHTETPRLLASRSWELRGLFTRADRERCFHRDGTPCVWDVPDAPVVPEKRARYEHQEEASRKEDGLRDPDPGMPGSMEAWQRALTHVDTAWTEVSCDDARNAPRRPGAT